MSAHKYDGSSRTVSAYTLCLHFNAGMTPAELKPLLERYGVVKGTVSKMVTVLEALWNGDIRVEDVTSLNAAYTLVKGFTPKWAEKLSDAQLNHLKNLLRREANKRVSRNP